jgi:hypothetical protein
MDEFTTREYEYMKEISQETNLVLGQLKKKLAINWIRRYVWLPDSQLIAVLDLEHLSEAEYDKRLRDQNNNQGDQNA